MRRPQILAVDDIPANLLAIEVVLQREFDVRLANSGSKAIAMLRADPDVDVILMDVQMPGMDGYETARRIKQLAGCEDIPIVFITAIYHEDTYVKRGYQAGGIDYFTKPFDAELLRLKLAIYASFRQKAAILRERERHLRETEELLAAGRKLTSVLESLPVGVLITDTDGTIIQTNDEVARIFKATRAIENDAYGTLLGWWAPGGDGARQPRGPLARALRANESSHNERLQITCLDGAYKTLFASASPLYGLEGRLVGAVIVIKDTSESTQIEAELETRVARLVSASMEIEQALDSPHGSGRH